jgi:cyclic 2,3-diphosphoglycerate synthase
VDGEHYPPVVEAALRDLAGRGHEVLAAVLVGGREKLPEDDLTSLAGVPVLSSGDPRDTLAESLQRLRCELVVDLSDEPVLGYRRRHEMAGVALFHGAEYRGPDFVFTPPPRPDLARKPSLAIIGTGKRTGKTAIAGFAARALVARGIPPAIVAMGRGGPEQPELLRGDEIELTPADLLEWADAGKHAASDYVEDALLGRVPTVGCRRCGGGLAGGVEVTNVDQGMELANELDVSLLLLEGSGAAIPPVRSDATALVVPANIPEEHLAGYMGPYRLLLADLVVVTMCEDPFVSPSQISAVVSRIESAYRPAGDPRGEIRVARTIFRPTPSRSVDGAKVLVATTAPAEAGGSIRDHLEDQGCRVTGITHSLSDRARLRAELEEQGADADVLLCEVKAAAVDVATRWGLKSGLEVVYMDNVPLGIDGDEPEEALHDTARLAIRRFEERKDD